MKDQIINTRNVIREHRDQIGDYRCWVDDEVLYFKTLPELKNQESVLPCRAEFTERCRLYFENRQDPNELNVVDIPLDSRVGFLNLTYDNQILDADLQADSEDRLVHGLETILNAIRAHRELGYERRTFQSDRDLYLILPEKTLAITKLPPRELFLGRGCPDYNDHCQKKPEDFIKGTWLG
jgi:hypothetical protein